MGQAARRSGTFLQRMVPRRNFNDKIDRLISKAVEAAPMGNLGMLIVGLNTFFFVLSWLQNEFQFAKNFTFSSMAFSRGYFWNIILCHFAHTSTFNYVIDSIIVALFCQNLSMTLGPIMIGRIILLSMAMGSSFLFLQHIMGASRMGNWCGNDAIFRGLVFSLIFSNPAAKLMLFPIPIEIPAYAIGILMLVLDFWSFNTAAFGGTTAAYMMVNNIL